MALVIFCFKQTLPSPSNKPCSSSMSASMLPLFTHACHAALSHRGQSLVVVPMSCLPRIQLATIPPTFPFGHFCAWKSPNNPLFLPTMAIYRALSILLVFLNIPSFTSHFANLAPGLDHPASASVIHLPDMHPPT